MSPWMNEFAAWWAALAPEWMFLVLLPFAVAAVALLVHRPHAPAAQEEPARPVPPLRRRHHHRGSH
jgi:hypothetical protein